MSSSTEEQIIEQLFSEFQENYNYLMESQQISFANGYKSQFSKALLLSSASFFEVKVLDTIKNSLNPSSCEITTEFIQNKALTRQYHSLFDWDKSNANKFFALFGQNFKEFMVAKIKNSTELNSAITDFLVIGSTRNQLAHQNYAMYSLQMTADEIYKRYNNANNNFVQNLEAYIREFRNQKRT